MGNYSVGRAFGMDTSGMVGGLPAITKGFIDRLFLPGMAYKYRENSILWDKLLKGKTTRIITTLDQPLVLQAYVRKTKCKPTAEIYFAILWYISGKVTYIGIIRNSPEASRKKWLQQVKDWD